MLYYYESLVSKFGKNFDIVGTMYTRSLLIQGRIVRNESFCYDLDFVENRKHDLLLEDGTDYDAKLSDIVTDYVDLVHFFQRFFNLGGPRGTQQKKLQNLDSINQ